jgi:protein-tyrosine phosphatase
MVDLHSHILPGLDDGPPDLAASLALARAAVAGGVRVMTATPHIDHGFGLGPETVHPAVEALRTELAREEIALDVRAGGEIALSRLPELDDGFLRGVALGGGPWLLVECPFGPGPLDLEIPVRDLRDRGHEVLLAHPERCHAVQRDPSVLARGVAAGALAQVTAGSLLGDFGGRVRSFALGLLRRGLLHVAASDSHDAVARPPGARGAFGRLERELPGARALGRWMTETVPAALLAGEPVPVRPA